MYTRTRAARRGATCCWPLLPGTLAQAALVDSPPSTLLPLRLRLAPVRSSLMSRVVRLVPPLGGRPADLLATSVPPPPIF